MWLRAGRGGRGRALPDHEQDAGGAEICCRPDRRPGMTQDLAGAAPARGRSPAVDRVGRSRSPHPRALCGRRSASHACGQRRRVVRRAESRRARCARGRRALVVCARSPRAGGRQLTERGARSRSESGCPVPQIAKSNKKNAVFVLADSRKYVEVRVCFLSFFLSRKYAVSSVLGARPRPRPRTGPATCRANWLVGGGAASPSDRRK